jgi:hypothetical protein
MKGNSKEGKHILYNYSTVVDKWKDKKRGEGVGSVVTVHIWQGNKH